MRGFFIILTTFSFFTALGQHPCGTRLVEEFKNSKSLNPALRINNTDSVHGLITIPIVFHIIYNQEAGGFGTANTIVSDQQIFSQVTPTEGYYKFYWLHGHSRFIYRKLSKPAVFDLS